MKIKYIHVKNFKSLIDQEINFEDLSVLVGANASGKSNVISIFRFINNIIIYGIDNAISLMGGIDYTVNAIIGKKEPIYIHFVLDLGDHNWIRNINKKKGFGLKINEVIYKFEILANKKGQGYKITKDFMKIIYNGTYTDINKSKVDIERTTYTDEKYYISFEKIKNHFECNVKDETCFGEKDIDIGLGADFLIRFINEDKKELILNKIDFLMPPTFNSYELIKIYDFDPKLLKKSCSLTSIRSLEEDGSNLANVLQVILKDKNSRRKLVNLLSECLPFIEQISVENSFDKSISYKIKEKYSKKTFYANFMSDGTVNIIAVIVALFFNNSNQIIVIEEPERNLHPKLMEKIVEMSNEASKYKQVIITTHNPELIKYTDIESIYLIKRCDKGFTSVCKPAESNTIKTFLNTELGISDLFVQDLLGE